MTTFKRMDKMPQDQPNSKKQTNIENDNTLTTRQGQPVTNNQDLRTVGNRGPAALENYDYIEKISHFDRERIPERVVHARGTGAHGYFETYGTVGKEPISKYTRAKLFQEKGDRKSTRLNSSHVAISYAVFCLKKKIKKQNIQNRM